MTRFLRHRLPIFALICAAALTLCACGSGQGTLPNEKMRIYFLDVGQGDCTLIRTAEGDILIDAGPEASQERLCLRLRQLGVERLRLMVLTHYDEDHIGGADGILRMIPVDEVWGGEANDDNESLRALRLALVDQGRSVTPVCQKDQRTFGDTRITALTPWQVPVPEGNEGSLVLQVVCGDVTALFTGDIDAATEELLVATYPGRLSAQIYQVGNHGSSPSNGP
ncbi:MAG: MBL fold metallo-hydrolase, partial [Clostridia bacterium]|nr:MBL fold metallo-hydrolase [Clostridia bacterium]